MRNSIACNCLHKAVYIRISDACTKIRNRCIDMYIYKGSETHDTWWSTTDWWLSKATNTISTNSILVKFQGSGSSNGSSGSDNSGSNSSKYTENTNKYYNIQVWVCVCVCIYRQVVTQHELRFFPIFCTHFV